MSGPAVTARRNRYELFSVCSSRPGEFIFSVKDTETGAFVVEDGKVLRGSEFEPIRDKVRELNKKGAR